MSGVNRGRRISRRVPVLAGVAALGASTAVLADNPFGLYVGAGVGTATIENKYEFYDPNGFSGSYHDNDAAWKLIAGLKPIPLVGAEIEYIDFGKAGGHEQVQGAYEYTSVTAHPKATVLYGLGYLPLPLPFIDVYGKLGVARLQTDNSYQTTPLGTQPGTCTVAGCSSILSRFDQQNTKFAYGAGVQAKFQDFAFRGEYERISSSYGDPAAITVSVTWTF